MKKRSFKELSIILFIAVFMIGCTKYFDPVPKFDKYEQEKEFAVKRKVLLISIDGLVGSELKKKVPKHIASLMKSAKYTFDAKADLSTSDVVTWSTMLTGHEFSKHNILDNTYLPNTISDDVHGDIPISPSVVSRIEEVEPLLKTSVIVQDPGLSVVLLADADDNKLVSDDNMAVQEAALLLSKDITSDFMIVQFRDVLKAGKESRFVVEESKYAEAIEAVDVKIGELLEILANRESAKYEDWLIVITSNHGGIGNSYGGDSFEERNIFALFSQQNFQSLEFKIPATMASVRFYGYSSIVKGIRALNTKESDEFNMDSNKEMTLEIRYNWAASKTIPWTRTLTPIGGADFEYAPLVTKMDDAAGSIAGWGIYTLDKSIYFTVNDGTGTTFPQVFASRSNGYWGVLTARVKQIGINTEIALFVNGVLSQRLILANFDFEVDNPAPFVMGFTDELYLSDIPDFRAASVRFWKRALTEEEITKFSCVDELTQTDLTDDKLIGEWNLKYANQQKIFNRANPNLDLHFEGVQPYFSEQELFSSCKVENLSEAFIQNIDIVPQVYYWLKIKPSASWSLDGNIFLSKYEVEFLK